MFCIIITITIFIDIFYHFLSFQEQSEPLYPDGEDYIANQEQYVCCLHLELVFMVRSVINGADIVFYGHVFNFEFDLHKLICGI